LAILAEFAAAPADRLDAADVRPGGGDRGGGGLAALDRFGDRAGPVAGDLLAPRKTP